MEKTLKVVAAVYAAIMVAALTVLPVNGHSYTMEAYGPLPGELSSTDGLLYYEAGGPIMMTAHPPEGAGVLVVNGSRGTLYGIPRALSVLSACPYKGSIIILYRDASLNTALAVLGGEWGAWKVIVDSAPLRVSEARLYCGGNSVILVGGSSRESFILSLNPARGDAKGASIRAGYKDSTAKNDTVALLLAGDGSSLVALVNATTLQPVESMRVGMDAYKIVYSDTVYVLGSTSDSALVWSREGASYTVSYPWGPPRIEAVEERLGRLVILARPPGSWMQVVEEANNAVSVVELMYTSLYSYEGAGNGNRGFWAVGFMANGTSKTIVAVEVARDEYARVGYPGTIMAAKVTDGQPRVSAASIKAEPAPYAAGVVDAALEGLNVKPLKLGEFQLEYKVYYEVRDPVASTLTSLVIALVFVVPSYTAARLYITRD